MPFNRANKNRGLTEDSTCVASATRIYFMHLEISSSRLESPNYGDASASASVWVGTAVEANVAIVCASAPSLGAYSRYCIPVRASPHSFGWYKKVVWTMARQ